MKSLLTYTTTTTCKKVNGGEFYIHKFEFVSGEKTRLGSLKKGVGYNLPSAHDWTEDQSDLFEGGLEITLDELKEEYDIVIKKFFAEDPEGKEEHTDEETGEVIKGSWKEARYLYEKITD